MKKIVAILVLVLSLSTTQTKASHFAAMDIWYEYVSPLTYKVHVACYLDCCQNCANYFVSTVCWYSTSGCGTSGTAPLDTIGANDPLQNDTVSQLCAGVPNYCASASSIYPAFHYRHFVKTITLSNTCADWNFAVNDGARNSSIANGFAGQNIAVTAQLNNVVRPINSSPYFSARPIPYICNNQPEVYQNVPLDPDLDSVVVVEHTPTGGGMCNNPSSLSFNGTNTLTNPFPISPLNPWFLNSQTGAASFTPTTNGIYVVSFQANDYDKITGAKVGSSMRDVQLVVLTCASPPPIVHALYNLTGAILDSLNGQYIVTVCPGTPLSFMASGQTSDTTHSVLIQHNMLSYANNYAMSSTTTANYSSSPIGGMQDTVGGIFSWTPGTSDFGNHNLIITFVDSTCTPGLSPIVLKSYMNVLIKVLPGVNAGGPYNYCPGGVPLQLNATGPNGITHWQWTVLPGQAPGLNPNWSSDTSKNPTATPNGTVDVVVEGTPVLTGCPNKDTVTLFAFPALIVSAGPDLTPCANDNIILSGTSNRPPIGPNTQHPNGGATWFPNSFFTANANTLTPSLTPLGSEQYVLTVYDSYGCKAMDTVNVTIQGVRPIIAAYADRDTVCIGEKLKLYSNAAPQPCGLSLNASTATPTFKTISNGNILNTVYTPFNRDLFDAYRSQYLITADELIAAGLTPGNISGLSLNVQSAPSNGSADSLLGFNIRLGCTGQTSLSSTTGFVNGLTSVFSVNKYGTTLGANTFNFPLNKTYFWDGKSNLIVEFCYNLPQYSGGQPDVVYSSSTLYNSALVDFGINTTNGCSLTGIGGNAAMGPLRPNFKLLFSRTNTFSYKWLPSADFVNDTLENDVVKPGLINGTTTFTVNVKSGAMGQCNGSDEVTVYIDNSGGVVPTATPAHLCEPGLTTLNATPSANTSAPLFNCGEENYIPNGAPVPYVFGTSTTSTYNTPFVYNTYGAKSQFIFRASELTAAGATKGRIDAMALNIKLVNTIGMYESFKISMGCTKDNQFANSFVNLGSMKQVYFAPIYTTTAGVNNFVLQTPFLWDGISNLVVEVCYSGKQNNDPTGDDVNCSNAGFAASYVRYLSTWNDPTIDGCGMPFSAQGNLYSTSTYRPNTTFIITPVANKAFQYVWTPPLYVYDSAKAQTLAYVLHNTTYTVALVNRTGCLIKDTVNVRIETHDVNLTPKDTILCTGDKIQLFAYGTGTDQSPVYSWFPFVNITPVSGYDTTVIISPLVNTIYNVVRTDMFGCKDTSSSNISVVPSPNVQILNDPSGIDTLNVLYGDDVTLVASGALVYTWTPIWGTGNNATTNSMYIHPLQDGMYYVYGSDTNGCRNYDSIFIKMIDTNQIFIPSVFTPNGDGKNDMFRVQHYKFEKVQEFRVFDRWGNEVFSGRDNEGWDGTFKGKLLDMDTYAYIIKLAYPDGKVKAIKGEVLLMK